MKIKDFTINKQWYWECEKCGANGYVLEYKDIFDRIYFHRQIYHDCDKIKREEK